MDIESVRSQIEEEQTWRRDELRHLRNNLGRIATEDQRRTYRKSLIVMLYAHFEGYMKAVLALYAKAVTGESVQCSDASSYLAAATLAPIFDAAEHSEKKEPFFKAKLPDDAKLHRFARRVELVANLDDALSRPVSIDDDRIVDTESNLSPTILRKILFQLGFPHRVFEPYEPTINRLLNERNNIAHGSRRVGLDHHDYYEIEQSVGQVMEAIADIVIAALVAKAYLRNV